MSVSRSALPSWLSILLGGSSTPLTASLKASPAGALCATAHIIRIADPTFSVLKKDPPLSGSEILGGCIPKGDAPQIVCLRRGTVRSVSQTISAAIVHLVTARA